MGHLIDNIQVVSGRAGVSGAFHVFCELRLTRKASRRHHRHLREVGTPMKDEGRGKLKGHMNDDES